MEMTRLSVGAQKTGRNGKVPCISFLVPFSIYALFTRGEGAPFCVDKCSCVFFNGSDA